MTYELDVMATEYIEHDSALAGDMTRDGAPLPVDVNTLLKGRLHLRLANVGHPADHKLTRAGTTHRHTQLLYQLSRNKWDIADDLNVYIDRHMYF